MVQNRELAHDDDDDDICNSSNQYTLAHHMNEKWKLSLLERGVSLYTDMMMGTRAWPDDMISPMESFNNRETMIM